MRLLSCAVLLLLSVTRYEAFAEEPDFYLAMRKCSTTAGYLNKPDASLKTIEGTAVMFACTRSGKNLRCEMSFEGADEGGKGSQVGYVVSFDSPPHLYFTDNNAGDFFAVNTANHAAVMITRIAGDGYLASKVCQGVFLTHSEMQTLNKTQK